MAGLQSERIVVDVSEDSSFSICLSFMYSRRAKAKAGVLALIVGNDDDVQSALTSWCI